MIIAIATSEAHLKSNIDPHFGRCDWYFLYDTETESSDFIENKFRYQNEKAGTDAAAFLIAKGIKLVVAGRFGSKATEIFDENDVQMLIPEPGVTITKFIQSLK